MVSTTAFLAILSVATASPVIKRAFPPVSMSAGFTIVANVTDPAKSAAVFSPPVTNWYLNGVHTGAGISAAVLAPEGGPVFFVNGTGRDVSAAATSIALPPIDSQPPTPWGLKFSQGPEYVSFGLNFGLPDHGAGVVPGLRSSYPLIFAPFTGSFAVCNETQPMYGRPQYPVRIFNSQVPDNCVAIELFAQCAVLPEIHGKEELNITVESAKCYDNVAAINWSQY